jgi:hypothetical protein
MYKRDTSEFSSETSSTATAVSLMTFMAFATSSASLSRSLSGARRASACSFARKARLGSSRTAGSTTVSVCRCCFCDRPDGRAVAVLRRDCVGAASSSSERTTPRRRDITDKVWGCLQEATGSAFFFGREVDDVIGAKVGQSDIEPQVGTLTKNPPRLDQHGKGEQRQGERMTMQES